MDELLAGLPVDLEYLENPKNRVQWSVYYKILERLTRYYPDQQAQEDLGLLMVSTPNEHVYFRRILGLVLSPKQIFKMGWMWTARSEWPHANFSYEELPDGRLVLDWEMDQSEPCSTALHFITAGILVGYPKMIGLGEAVVETEATSHYAKYTITLPPSLTLFAKLGRILRIFRSSRNAIDELSKQQQEIAETEKKFRAIAETAADAIVMADSDMNVSYWNRAAETIFGYPASEVIGQPYTVIIPERYRAAEEDELQSALQSSRGYYRGEPVERVGLRKDGTEFPIETSVASWRTEQDVFFTAIIRDITRRKQIEEKVRQSEEQYRNLAQHLMTMQDDERSRLSRDLHDSLGQQLATLALHNGLVKKKVQSQLPEVVGDFNEISRLLKEAIEECHRLAFELTPPSFQRLGLASAVKEATVGYAQRTGVEVTFEESLNRKKLPEDVEISLFRILQEALSNIHSHASADKVEVRLFEDDGSICFVVEDDGKGFDLEKLSSIDMERSKRGLGLLSMRERVKKFNGRLEIFSKVGEGTKVSVIIPDVEG